MKTGMSKVRINFIRVFISLFLVGFVLFCCAIKVSAAGWVDKDSDVYETLYGSEGDAGAGSGTEVEEEEPGMVESFFSGLITSLSKQLNNLLSSQDINLSIDGIVFGRMAAGLTGGGYVKADFTHFGLEENNPWGIIGATVFYALRNICLVVLPIILLALLILELFHDTGAGRARLKELAMHTVYVFGLLFILPYALDLFIYFRDVVLFSVYQAMQGLVAGISGSPDSGSVGIVEMMLDTQDGRILNALVLLSSVCAGLFFLVDYIRIALLLTLSFGLFPVVAVMSFWNHKKLSEWSSVFFPNLLVPFIDMLLVLIPTVLNALFARLFGNGLDSVLVGLIILIVIWNVVTVRNRIVKLLGFDGMGGGGGFGQMIETLSHLRPHNKKEENGKDKPEREKEKADAGSTYSENNAYSGSSGEMSPAVSGVVNSDSAGAYQVLEMQGKNTDELLAGMEESEERHTSQEVDIESENKQLPDAEAEVIPAMNELSESGTDTLPSDMEEPKIVTPQPVEGMSEGIAHEKSVNEDFRGGTERVSDGNKASAAHSGRGNNENRKDEHQPKAKEVVKMVAETSAKIAVGGALGVTGTFAAGYGGMGTSVGAGIVAAHGGSKLVDVSGDVLGHAPEAVEKGSHHVKEAVLAAYQRDYEAFGVEPEEFNFRSTQETAKKNAAQGAKEANKKRAALELEAQKAYKAADEKAHKDFVD